MRTGRRDRFFLGADQHRVRAADSGCRRPRRDAAPRRGASRDAVGQLRAGSRADEPVVLQGPPAPLPRPGRVDARSEGGAAAVPAGNLGEGGAARAARQHAAVSRRSAVRGQGLLVLRVHAPRHHRVGHRALLAGPEAPRRRRAPNLPPPVPIPRISRAEPSVARRRRCLSSRPRTGGKLATFSRSRSTRSSRSSSSCACASPRRVLGSVARAREPRLPSRAALFDVERSPPRGADPGHRSAF